MMTSSKQQEQIMPAIEKHQSTDVARPLRVLVPLIKEALSNGKQASERAGMPYYQTAGELMLEAKPQLSHGEFGPWIKRNFNIGPQHASRYMAFARATAGKQNSRFENFSDFMRKDGGDPSYGKVVRKQDWHAPVKEQIDRAKREAERLREESLTRQQERQAEQGLALRLIEIGYKVLAKELHPDKGGSRDAMARLNKVRDRLKMHA
jgi:hypothetical protein